MAVRARAPRAAPPRAADALAVGAIVVLLVVLWAKVAHLFPQVEFLDWLASPAGSSIRSGIDAMWKFSDDGFSRHVSLMSAASIGRVCGTSVVCINTLAFLPLAAGALLLYALGRVLGLPAAAAAGVVAVLLVSEPTFNVLTWQATLHDRWAAAATPFVLLLVVAMVRRARLTWAFALPWAVGLAVACLLAVNTKEPAWVIVGMVALAPMLARDRRQVLAAAAIVALPVVVMVVHVVTDLHGLADDPTARDHVNSGSISDNLPVLARYAVPGGGAVLAVLAALAVAGVVAGWAARRTRPEALEAARVAAWVTIGAAGGWLIPLKTSFPSAFYLLVPIGMTALAVALGLRAGALAAAGRGGVSPRAAGIAAAVVGVVLVGWCTLGSALDRWGPYGDWLAWDRHFRSELPGLAAFRRAHPAAMVQFGAAEGNPYAYRFVTANPATDFWRMVGATQPVDRVTSISALPARCGDRRTFVVVLRADMHVAGICPRP